MVAITNGTAQPYTVEKIWYHPGVRRFLRNERSLVVRSTKPGDGPVDPSSPDLAVLQLSSAGPPLPNQLSFATPSELDVLFAQPIGVDKSKLRIARWLTPDKQTEINRRAIALAAEAQYLIEAEQKFAAGVAKATEAIKIAPNYPDSYSIRSTGYLMYVFENHRRIDRDLSLAQLGYARKDAEKYIRLVPSDPYGFVRLASVMNNTAFITQDKNEFRRVLDLGNRLMTSDNLTPHRRAEAHTLRGLGYSNLGDHDRAVREYNEAIRLAPYDPGKWETRADYWYNLGQLSNAESDRRKGRELREKMKRQSN